MTKRAQLADGTVLEFPDETADEVMDRVVRSHVSGASDRAPPGGMTRPDGQFVNSVGRIPKPGPALDPTDGMSFGQQVGSGYGRAFVETGRGLKQLMEAPQIPGALPGLSALLAPQSAESKAQTDSTRATDAPLLNSPGGFTGNLIGQVAQTAVPIGGGASLGGRAAPYLAAGARGAAWSGSQTVGTGETRAGNAGEGAAYGAAGQALAGGLSRIAKGASDKLAPEVRALYAKAQAAGIPVHFSQLTDSKFVKTLASTLSYLPFSGGAAKAAKQQEAFNQAAGRSFGADAKVLTDDVMHTAKQNLGAAYDRLFAGKTIGLDGQAVQDLFKLHAVAGRDLESSGAQVARNQILRILDEAGHQGAMPGKVYQSLRSELRNQFGKETPIGRVVMQARKILDDSAARELGPVEAAALKKLNAAYADFGTVRDALKQIPGAAGNVRPASLWPLVRNGSTKDMRELAKVGQLIKDPIPDSGTAGRLLTTGLVGGSSLTGGIGPLAQLMALGATVGRAANSEGAARYLAQGAGKNTKRVLEGLARPLPRVLPALGTGLAAPVAAKPKKDKR